MDKYEISLWEDFIDISTDGTQFLNERKLCVIGSDTMTAQARAIEPNLITNINGTSTLTFKMYYIYIDNQTGEKYQNPFLNLLINERKVKCYWKDKWYDLVIKKCQEDTSKKIITYTCIDIAINELSKNGYNLEFSTELMNNIGTAAELTNQVLEDTTWSYDNDNSTPIIQKSEGPVYEVTTQANLINVIKQSNLGNSLIYIPAGKKILVFYSSIVDLMDATGQTANVQFLYDPDGYETDINDILVTNGYCCEIQNCSWTRNGNYLIASRNNTLFSINIAAGVSENYRAERLVQKQISEYDKLLDRYVNLCKTDDGDYVYELATTEYSDPLSVINLIANPNSFKNVDGWIGAVDTFQIYPPFDSTTDVSNYSATSYLRVSVANGSTSSQLYNSALQSNISYFTPTDTSIKQGKIGGIQKGEKYILRIKARYATNNGFGKYINTAAVFNGSNIYKRGESDNNKYGIRTDPNDYWLNHPVFSSTSKITKDHWIEYTLTCERPLSADTIDEYGLFLMINEYTPTGSSTAIRAYGIEDVQFFKYMVGKTSYEIGATEQRMNPGEISLQSIVYPIYKYYEKNNHVKSANKLTYLVVSETRLNDIYKPQYNNFERIGTINIKESNRFNILQTIAETFQCWIRFNIEHETNGAIKFNNKGIPIKKVAFVQTIGEETGLAFEYGIDLKTISRNITSDNIVTKTIVKNNANQFAPNGFCSIARSSQNYTKENFVLNLDYYTQQGLLKQQQITRDLYSTSVNYIGYYYYLHKLNTEYDNIYNTLYEKYLDRTKQQSQKEIYEQYILAATKQKESIESDLMQLAGVKTWSEVTAYARQNTSNVQVQTLLNSHAQVKNQISSYNTSLREIKQTLTILENYITEQEERLDIIRDLLKAKHEQFNIKYFNYIQEGTWQDESYVNDDEYFIDALNVAYTSSRPQITYSINVLRLSSLEEFSSKIFNLGDICYIVDREYFGYKGLTPYKEKVLVSEITSYFDQPEKDIIKVQNYKTRFDDLFQRITATTQSLQYAQGEFTRAAGAINPDKTLSFSVLQDTLDYNEDLVINASNQDVTWDSTGITVTNKFNSADKTKIIAGGIFITNDGGQTWKNAIRGDGISTELLTSGRVNTSEIYIYDGNHPSFRWDSNGLTAYKIGVDEKTLFNSFVRHDNYGIYGYSGVTDFIPSSEEDIWNNAKFGLTWKGFFLKNKEGDGYVEISTDNDIVVYDGNIPRIQIGRINRKDETFEYGIVIKDSKNKNIFYAGSEGATIGGWNITENSLYNKGANNSTVGFYSEGKEATIMGNKTKYYILAGKSFGVTINGDIYAKAGKIGGWNITSNSLYSGEKNDEGFNGAYTLINADGTLKGYTNNGSYWEITKNGNFHFVSTQITPTEEETQPCIIQLGPTTITNHYIYTTNINASGGTIGGWSIDSGGLYLKDQKARITTSGIGIFKAVALYTESYANFINSDDITHFKNIYSTWNGHAPGIKTVYESYQEAQSGSGTPIGYVNI